MNYNDSYELRMRGNHQWQKKTGIDPHPCQVIASIMESEHEEKKRGEVTAVLRGSCL